MQIAHNNLAPAAGVLNVTANWIFLLIESAAFDLCVEAARREDILLTNKQDKALTPLNR
jgi:hypothetical protein